MVRGLNEEDDLDEITFDIDAVSSASSAAVVARRPVNIAHEDTTVETGPTRDLSPVFRELADRKLPELPREARARLLMQSPTRLYFYWSAGANPYAPLDKALGSVSGYRLALRLLDLTRGTEELHGIDQEGSWWFDVRPDTEYRAEVGFYSPSRPFVRILFSNTVATPRKGPSPHRSSEARWMISAGKFADVLEASGFTSDAVEVARTEETGDLARRFAREIDLSGDRFAEFNRDELQQVLERLAAGTPIADLKWKISAELYARLEEHFAKLFALSIRESLGIVQEDLVETMTAVGGSVVNIRKPMYKPISSLALR